MSSALEAFRAQREEVEQIHARLTQVVKLLRAIRSEANVLTHDEPLRKLLQEEQTWLLRTKDLIRQVQYFRESEAADSGLPCGADG
jgi:ABC-type sugar transport system ATPase subunit